MALVSNFCRFLKLDSRNFHAWKYRREIVKLAGTDIEDELVYSRQLIDENFSNYSAWHARTALLTEKFSTQQVVSLQELMAGSGSGISEAISPQDTLSSSKSRQSLHITSLVSDAFKNRSSNQKAFFEAGGPKPISLICYEGCRLVLLKL